MSAFVMDERFFNQLAADLLAHATLSRSSLNWGVLHVLELRDVPENRYEEKVREFVTACYALNVNVVNYRYAENSAPDAIRFKPANGLAQWTDVQLCKYLECLSSQCAEGDCESNETYGKLETLIGQVARAIVGNTNRYTAANWDYRAA